MTILPPDPDLDALRRELEQRRAAAGWSYDQLAERTGLARRTLIEIEQGRTIGTLAIWHAIAHGLGVPVGDLFSHLCDRPRTPGTAHPLNAAHMPWRAAGLVRPKR